MSCLPVTSGAVIASREPGTGMAPNGSKGRDASTVPPSVSSTAPGTPGCDVSVTSTSTVTVTVTTRILANAAWSGVTQPPSAAGTGCSTTRNAASGHGVPAPATGSSTTGASGGVDPGTTAKMLSCSDAPWDPGTTGRNRVVRLSGRIHPDAVLSSTSSPDTFFETSPMSRAASAASRPASVSWTPTLRLLPAQASVGELTTKPSTAGGAVVPAGRSAGPNGG